MDRKLDQQQQQNRKCLDTIKGGRHIEMALHDVLYKSHSTIYYLGGKINPPSVWGAPQSRLSYKTAIQTVAKRTRPMKLSRTPIISSVTWTGERAPLFTLVVGIKVQGDGQGKKKSVGCAFLSVASPTEMSHRAES